MTFKICKLIREIVTVALLQRFCHVNANNNGSTEFERIVTDLNVIHFGVGVPVDFSYNQTNNEGDDDIASAPGCPKSINGLPFVYFGEPPRCQLVGTSSVCPPGQLLFGKGSKSTLPLYGFCDCVCPTVTTQHSSKEMKRNEFYGTNVTDYSTFRFCTLNYASEVNSAVFDKKTGSCFYLETQGPCTADEWFVKDESRNGFMCIPQCSFSTGPHASHTFDYASRKCVKKTTSSIQPVALASNIGGRDCDDGMVFSPVLNKCITKSKAFMVKMKY